MALNDIGLCARALVQVGAHPITSFADGTTEAEIAGLLYAPLRDALLSSYAWNFATRQTNLTVLTTSPAADFAYSYQLPNDFLRALSAGTGTRGRGLRYRIIGSALHTDADNVMLTYITRPAEETFPAYFDRALMARLAAEFCLPLSENTTRAQVLNQIAEQELARARQIDAQQDTPNRLENFPLIDVRE